MNLDEILLSEYGAASSVPSPVNKMMASFAADFRDDRDINLGVGYVNESTIPRALVQEAVAAVLGNPDKYRVALNYGGPAGSANLIESLWCFHVERQIGGITEEVMARNEIIIGPNGATSLLEGIAHVLQPGIVITSDPVYYIYSNFLERCGFEVVAVPEDEAGIDTARLRAKLDELGARKREVRYFYIVTVNNPTCTVLSNDRQRELIAIATELSSELGRKVPVFLDKAYENLLHDLELEEPESGLLHDELGIVYEIGTLSKILAPALRIGYMIGPGGPFLSAMVQKTSDVGFSAPLIAQEVASYLLDWYVSEQIDRVTAGYRKKAELTRRWLDELLGEWLADCRGGQAGFYFYLTLKAVETHERSAFFKFLSRTTGSESVDGPAEDRGPRVIYIPGEFCVHPRGEMVDLGKRQLRLSYGFEELQRIRAALELMAEAAAYALS